MNQEPKDDDKHEPAERQPKDDSATEPGGEPDAAAKTSAKPVESTGAKPPSKPPGKADNRRLLLRGGVVAAAILVALVAWLASRDSGNGSSAPAEVGPRIVSAAGLGEAAATLGQPVYWAGAMPGTELALSELPEGGTQVRYLPQGTEPKQASSKVLIVGSYPLADPKGSLAGFAQRPGAIVRHASDGREVISSEERPTSVYFASPDDSVQVEVYDPSPRRAMSLALSGRVVPAH